MTQLAAQTSTELIPCAHCEGTGTCTTDALESCAVCCRESKVKLGSKQIVCSVCGGLGVAETTTSRMRNRIVPTLAILIAYFSLVLVWFSMFLRTELFSEVLAFSATLVGSITGYYFGGRDRERT